MALQQGIRLHATQTLFGPELDRTLASLSPDNGDEDEGGEAWAWRHGVRRLDRIEGETPSMKVARA